MCKSSSQSRKWKKVENPRSFIGVGAWVDKGKGCFTTCVVGWGWSADGRAGGRVDKGKGCFTTWVVGWGWSADGRAGGWVVSEVPVLFKKLCKLACCDSFHSSLVDCLTNGRTNLFLSQTSIWELSRYRDMWNFKIHHHKRRDHELRVCSVKWSKYSRIHPHQRFLLSAFQVRWDFSVYSSFISFTIFCLFLTGFRCGPVSVVHEPFIINKKPKPICTDILCIVILLVMQIAFRNILCKLHNKLCKLWGPRCRDGVTRMNG